MIRILPADFERYCQRYPAEFRARVLPLATRTGDLLEFPRAAFDAVRSQFRRSAPVVARVQQPAEPSPAELATALGYAAFRAARAAILGERVVLTEPEFRTREAACTGCEFWDAAARGGLGKCRVCGCTGLKLWLATERCPKKKWPELPARSGPELPAAANVTPGAAGSNAGDPRHP